MLEVVNGGSVKASQLSHYPRLETVLSKTYRAYLNDICDYYKGSSLKSLLTPYVCFVDIAIRNSSTPYCGVDILSSSDRLNHHFRLLIGFVYSELNHHTKTKKYDYGNGYKRIFSTIAKEKNLSLHNLALSALTVTDDATKCIEEYKCANKNVDLSDYYKGWTCKSKDGREFNLHLATIYDAYGSDYTKKLHSAFSNYALTQKGTTFKNFPNFMVQLFNEFTLHCPSIKQLDLALKPENSTWLMLNVYTTLLAKVAAKGENVKGGDVKQFISGVWPRIIAYFSACFIDSGIFSEPIKPFIVPVFKTPKLNRSNTIPTGGKLTEKENERLLCNIPLEIKDEEALNIITDRIDRDLEHVRIITRKLIDETNARHERNQVSSCNGKIKPYPYHATRHKRQPFPIGPEHLDNTIATFYHYGYEGCSTRYGMFLGFRNKNDLCLTELNIPTPESLAPFLFQLVLNNPQITPAWLDQWELFDKSGNMTGFKQVGKLWVAVSFKNRRSATLAQQEIILSEHSQFVVKSLITHTHYAREELKKKGGSDWRYMLLTSTLTKVSRCRDIAQILRSNNNRFLEKLVKESVGCNGVINLTKHDAKILAPLVTLRSVRKAIGIQTYLKTHSIKAVSEALGHKQPDIKVLSSYLPQSLLEYFNERWVRIFQNAIIFEAMETSQYLIDALDFSAENLEKFLSNHRLGDMPDHLAKANTSIVNENNQKDIEQLDELVFTITTPLLQVLIAIITIVTTASNREDLGPFITKWYESAAFIISHFNLSGKSHRHVQGVKETQPLYDAAIKHPIDVDKIKGALLCL